MSQRDSGYERKERDLYETPEWVTESLLPHLPDRGLEIWEPACASGKMVRVLGRRHRVVATDISDTPPIDFLTVQDAPYGPHDAIVTNPPYEWAEEFIQRALQLSFAKRGLVAMLLRTDYDHAKTRSYLFGGSYAFAKKIVLTKRIKWFEDSKGQPSFNHAWFVWDHKNQGAAPTLVLRTMTNSDPRFSADICDAVAMLWKLIRFYDEIDRDHADGEAKLLDEAAAVVAAAQIPAPAQPTVKSGILTLDVEGWILSVRVHDGGYEVCITEDGKCPASHYVRLDSEQADTLRDFTVETSPAQRAAGPTHTLLASARALVHEIAESGTHTRWKRLAKALETEEERVTAAPCACLRPGGDPLGTCEECSPPQRDFTLEPLPTDRYAVDDPWHRPVPRSSAVSECAPASARAALTVIANATQSEATSRLRQMAKVALAALDAPKASGVTEAQVDLIAQEVWRHMCPGVRQTEADEAWYRQTVRIVLHAATLNEPQPVPEIQNAGNEAVISDIPWAVNYLLEQIAAKFEAWGTLDLFRSDAASTVRSFKHDLSSPLTRPQCGGK